MGKGQSKERFFTYNIGRRKEREGPEGECFMVNTAQPSDEGFSMCISREDLDTFSAYNGEQSALKVLLPPSENEFREKILGDELLKIEENVLPQCQSGLPHQKDKKDDDSSFIKLIVNDVDSQGNSTEKNIENFVKLIHTKMGENSEKCQACGNKSINIKLVIAQDESESAQAVNKTSELDLKSCCLKKSTPTKEKSSKKKKRSSSFRLKQYFNKTEENVDSRLEKDLINEKLRRDSHKKVSQSLNSSPATCTKYFSNEDKLNMSLPVEFNKRSSLVDANLPDLPFDIRNPEIPAEVTKPYLNELVKKSFQENNLYYRSKNHPKYRSRNTIGVECRDRRNHYLDLAGVEHCPNNSHHNKTDDQPNNELHLKTDKQRSAPQRSHSYNAYDSQFQYKKLHGHKKSVKYNEPDPSRIHEFSEPKTSHISKKQIYASKHIREHNAINQFSPVGSRKIPSNDESAFTYSVFDTHTVSHSKYPSDPPKHDKIHQHKFSGTYRVNKVDSSKHFQPIYESIELHKSPRWNNHNNYQDSRMENKYINQFSCIPSAVNSNQIRCDVVCESKNIDSQNTARKHSNCNFDSSSKCDRNRRYKQEHRNEHQNKGQPNNYVDKNRQSDCNKTPVPAKCSSEHLHCVQHVIHHHYHHYDLV